MSGALSGIVTAIVAVPCVLGAVALALNAGDTAKASQWLGLSAEKGKKKNKKEKEKDKKKNKKKKNKKKDKAKPVAAHPSVPMPTPVPQPEPEPEPQMYDPRDTEMYEFVAQTYEQAHASASPPGMPRLVGSRGRSSSPADMSERPRRGAAQSPA